MTLRECRTRLTLAMCGAVLLALALPARGVLAEPPGYRAAVDEAIAEFAAHHFEESRALFARAHELFPNARTLRGLGLTEFELRDYVRCIEHLEAALSASERPLEGALRADTEALRDRARGFIARLLLQSRPRARRVLVDGADTAWSPPQPIVVTLGPHTLELHTEGYEPERVSLQVTGGEERRVTIDFQRPIDRPREHRVEAHWYENPWLWTSVGVAVAAGTITAFLLASNSQSKGAPIGGTSGVVVEGI